MSDDLDRETVLIVMSFEAGAITADVAAAALHLTHAELFDLETRAAEQGAALARKRAIASQRGSAERAA